MKYTARIAILSALMCLTAKAAPFMAVGDNAELFVTAAASVSADDNIYLNTASNSDTVYSFTPGLDLVFGKGSVTTGDVYYREEVRRYGSHSAQNTELANVGAKADYTNGVTKANFNASYAEIAQNQVGATLTGDIAERDVSNLGAKVEFGVSEKTALSVGVSYAKTAYVPVAFVDSDIVSVPVDIFYQASPKMDWSLGYSYRATKLSGTGNDNQDNFFNLGARGEFTPKLKGHVKLGLTQRSFDIGSSETLFGAEGDLTFKYSEKTNIILNASNDFGNAGTGDSTKNFVLGANVSSQLTEQWALTAGISRRAINYSTRNDDYVEGYIGANYVYNRYVSLTASYTYRNNSSDKLASAEFTNNVFSLGANIRY